MLVVACCFRYEWDNEIQSTKSSWRLIRCQDTTQRFKIYEKWFYSSGKLSVKIIFSVIESMSSARLAIGRHSVLLANITLSGKTNKGSAFFDSALTASLGSKQHEAIQGCDILLKSNTSSKSSCSQRFLKKLSAVLFVFRFLSSFKWIDSLFLELSEFETVRLEHRIMGFCSGILD